MEELINFVTNNQTVVTIILLAIGISLATAVWHFLEGAVRMVFEIVIIIFILVSLGFVTSDQVKDFFLVVWENIKALDIKSKFLEFKDFVVGAFNNYKNLLTNKTI